jgi:hypothetical protein
VFTYVATGAAARESTAVLVFEAAITSTMLAKAVSVIITNAVNSLVVVAKVANIAIVFSKYIIYIVHVYALFNNFSKLIV